MKLSVIYVNYNTEKLLLTSLASLKKNFTSEPYEVIVVDNASRDFDGAPVKNIFPNAKIIKSEENLGFGRANNLAAKQAKGEYLWLLNTDTVIPPDNNLAAAIDFLDQQRDYGAASPMLLLASGQPQANQIGYFPAVYRQIVQKFASSSRFGMHVIPKADADVETMAAAAIFIRKSAFDKVGGFTPDYFMYYEDTDLWQKFKLEGYKIRFIRNARVTHLESQSVKNKQQLKKLYFASQDIYYRRWRRLPSRMMLKATRLVIKAKNWHERETGR